MIFPKITSFPIYWENGMKLSADHFQHQENSIEDADRDARAMALTAHIGFGLLPYSKFSVQNAQGVNSQSVRVILNACQAVLPGGHRVEILPENMQTLQLPSRVPFVEFVPSARVRYHLYLTVNEKKRIPAGVPQTRPIRHPFLTHDYVLECIPQDKVSAVQNIAANRMKIAEWQDGKILEGFIPATMTIRGFALLEKWYQFLQNQLENMRRFCTKVITEYRTKDVARTAFCIPIVQHIRSTQGYFKWVLPNQSPVHLVAYFGDLAGLVQGLIETGDRDFVRNRLQDGQANHLLMYINELLKLPTVPFENIALMIAKIQKFGEALLLTLQSLFTYTAPAPRMGDRNIVSG